jgi:arylsulfatase A-like enzyme
LANYYGDCKSIDESMGKIFQTLREQNLEDNTIVIFLSDHGCHFRTRNAEYKRSPHDSSTHVPLVIQGPGFNNGRKVSEMVSLVDIAPTLIDLLGLPVPSVMQGRSFLPVLNDPDARASWRNEVFIQTSESEIARALRTPEWTYVALAPDGDSRTTGGNMNYRDYQLYNNTNDPAQIINLAGRDDPPRLLHYGGRSMREITEDLRERLLARMVEAGEDKPEISRWDFYP